jgi:hypothetical protein
MKLPVRKGTGQASQKIVQVIYCVIMVAKVSAGRVFTEFYDTGGRESLRRLIKHNGQD